MSGASTRAAEARPSSAGGRSSLPPHGDDGGTAPAVRARDLSFTYPGGRAGLSGVDLEVRTGELVAALGPNGSGKSTLLRLLATAAPLQGGTLRLLGEAASDVARIRPRIGFGADVPVHAGPLTARESVELFGRLAGLDPEEAAMGADALLERIGLGPDAGASVSAFSLGMRRRLLLAEALIHSPDLVLLDEPTLGLDPDGLDRLARLLGETASGAAVVFATNDVTFAARVATRVLLLHRGRVAAEGPPAELLERVGAEAVVEVSLRSAAREAPTFPRGTRVEHGSGNGFTLRVPRGGGVLPGVLRAIEEAGAAVEAVSVREPDLGDVFRAVTGENLS